MSGKGLAPSPYNAPPMIVQDADPLRFRVGEPDPKTREFAAFIGDHHHRYFAAAAAAAAAANPHPHIDFRQQNFYSEKPINGNPNESGGSDGEDEIDVEEDEEDDEIDGNEGGDGTMNKETGEDSVSTGGAGIVVGEDNAGAYYSQHFKSMEASFASSRHEESSVAVENGCDFSGRRDPSSSSSASSIESLRTILSDPITYVLSSFDSVALKNLCSTF